MRFCQQHWDALRVEIDKRGLSKLVTNSGEEMVKKMAAELEQGRETKETFDPLMSAHWAIASNCMNNTPAGLALMQPNDDGTPRCPLCYCNEQAERAGHPAKQYDVWLGLAADDQLKRAQELGLVEVQ